MRKKYSVTISAIALMTAALMLSGCGESHVTDAEGPESVEETADTDPAGDKDPEDESGDNEDETAPVTPDITPSPETFALYSYVPDSPIYILDENGNILNSFYRKDLQASVPAGDSGAYRFYDNDPDSGHATLEAEGDGFMFFSDYRKISDDPVPEYTRVVYAVRESDLKIYDVWEEAAASYIRTDYYDSAFYVDRLDYDGYIFSETRIVYDEKSDSFTEESDPEMDALLDGISGQNMSIVTPGELSYRRTLDECGYLLCNIGGDKRLLNAKGRMVDCAAAKDHYIQFYDAGHIYYINDESDPDSSSLVVYDIKTDDASVIYTSEGYLSLHGTMDGKVCFSEHGAGDEDYGIAHVCVYEYDPASGSVRQLYDVTSVPGSNINPGVEQLTIHDGQIYYVDFKDGGLKWFCSDTDGPDPTPEDIDCLYLTLDAFEYGTVSYLSETYTCPDCGKELSFAYSEYFILDDEVSPHSAEINEALKEYAESFVSRPAATSYNDSPCTDHLEHPDWYQITNDMDVFDIEIISDRYIAINMSGYWYGGGAHGMPLREQLLFDLETGKQMTVEDFYTGSEEDFRRLVAEKTKEDYLSYKNGGPYFAEDADEAYEDAYNYCTLTGGTTEFTSEGMIYYFTPYALGPYAAGFIDILIPYEDLLGRDSL